MKQRSPKKFHFCGPISTVLPLVFHDNFNQMSQLVTSPAFLPLLQISAISSVPTMTIFTTAVMETGNRFSLQTGGKGESDHPSTPLDFVENDGNWKGDVRCNGKIDEHHGNTLLLRGT